MNCDCDLKKVLQTLVLLLIIVYKIISVVAIASCCCSNLVLHVAEVEHQFSPAKALKTTLQGYVAYVFGCSNVLSQQGATQGHLSLLRRRTDNVVH